MWLNHTHFTTNMFHNTVMQPPSSLLCCAFLETPEKPDGTGPTPSLYGFCPVKA